MTINEFFIKYNGRYLDADGAFGNQCADVIKAYYKEVLGLPPLHGNAIDYKDKPGFIKKTPLNHPEPGDIIVFNIGQYGHIGVCNWWRWFDLNIFQQNDPIGSPCGFKTYSYKNVLGWLRLKPSKLTMNYTCFNADTNLMEKARKLLVEYSKGKVDCTFDYKTVPTTAGVFTTDKQIQFLKTHSTNQFVFYFYNAGISYSQMATAEVPGTSTVMTCATPTTQDPLYICYEFVNALYANRQLYGNDIYTPTPEFIKTKLNKLLESGVFS